ncbi:MAG TPA: rhamnogalacturonan acetylesterase [Chthoniobacteraceae bacterium]|nr:rhamnogalacturonan acetylesterase [Chthoniobacteraceae bacterium]
MTLAGILRGLLKMRARLPRMLFSALAVALVIAGPVRAQTPPRARIALAGDSTVKDEGGWGFGFKKKLAADVVCENFAQGGQSSKSFRDTGQWKKVLASKADYVLIQFGHNDMPGKGPKRETDPATTYPENMARFVAEARDAGAKPILVTSLARRVFEPNGKLRGELAPYVEAVRKVAAEQHVPLIDLFARSVELVEKLGPKGVEPFEPKIVPKGALAPGATKADIDNPAASATPRRDGTHLTERGSIEFGAIVAEEMQKVLPETRPLFR